MSRLLLRRSPFGKGSGTLNRKMTVSELVFFIPFFPGVVRVVGSLLVRIRGVNRNLVSCWDSPRCRNQRQLVISSPELGRRIHVPYH